MKLESGWLLNFLKFDTSSGFDTKVTNLSNTTTIPPKDTMKNAQKYFDDLNKEYLAIHKQKEDLFWKTYMGVTDDHDAFAKAEVEFKEYISDATHIAKTREHISSVEKEKECEDKCALLRGLNGWLLFFESNAIEDDVARGLQKNIIKLEADLFAKKKTLDLKHIDEAGNWVSASLPSAGANLLTNTNEEARKSSLDVLKKVEHWVLDNGFIEIVKERNKFAKAMGYRNFFDFKVQKEERMTPENLFEILDDFEKKTRDSMSLSLSNLIKEKGCDATKAHNIRFNYSGDISRQVDPYMPFAKSIERWILSFARMGIEYRDATLSLDLIDRKGKYENGFMHSPTPCFYDKGAWVPAVINFTSVAKPDQVGSGSRALATLFHEGGHAAHFSNITQNAPCFSQEFPPTSMAYAETQSMFCDSLLDDADWMKSYAKDKDNNPMPDNLIKKVIESTQPVIPFGERQILLVPYFEWALYQLLDEELTKEKILDLARDCEQKIIGIPESPRPLLAIPHLLNQDSACAYHGYLLAHMAVYQTRAYFIKKYGYLADNPNIGQELAKHYWQPGNSISHDDSLKNLTGMGFSATALAQLCNQTIEEAWKVAQKQIALLEKRNPLENNDCLNATIKLVHGDKIIAQNNISNRDMMNTFETWIEENYPG